MLTMLMTVSFVINLVNCALTGALNNKVTDGQAMASYFWGFSSSSVLGEGRI